jgi:hypothetical protein
VIGEDDDPFEQRQREDQVDDAPGREKLSHGNLRSESSRVQPSSKLAIRR